MTKRILFFLLFSSFLHAQNLVPNPSFEDTIGCPHNLGQVFNATGWISYGLSSDYYNSCEPDGITGVPQNVSGYQIAASGAGYCGIFTHGFGINYREFIGRELQSQLIPGVTYYISIYVSVSENSNCASNNIGVLFTNLPYTEAHPAPIINHAHVYSHELISDSTNWVTVSGSFIADSAYNYIIVGNFFDDAHTDSVIFFSNTCNAYYFIDDVCVSTDSSMCQINTGIDNHPNDETIRIAPNPAISTITISLPAQPSVLTIHDIMGRKMYSANESNKVINLRIVDFPNGIYFLTIQYNHTFQTVKFLIQK